MKKAVLVLVSIFAVFAHPRAEAQAVIALDSVVVTARPAREIVPAQILGGEQLQRLSAHSVADALRYFSGVQIKDYGGIGGLKTVNVRSLGSHHTGVFYDGIQVGNAQNGVVDLGRFSLDNVEAVGLYNGQVSDIFQSAKDFASASALYMSSRKPIFARGRKNNLKLKLSGGSFDLLSASALWERRLGKRLSASANVEFLNTSGRYKYRYKREGGYDTTAIRRNGHVRLVRAEAGLFGSIRGGEWRVKGYFYTSRRGYPGAVIKEDHAISLLNEDRQTDRNVFVQGSLQQELSPLYSYRIRAKYAHDYMNYVMPPGTTLQPMDAHYRQREAYLSVANLFSFTHWLSANISVDGQWNSLNADGTALFNRNFPQPRRLTLLGAGAVSVRLKKFSAQTSLLYTHTHDVSAREMAMAPDRNVFTPTLVLSYRPWTHIGLETRAFYKHTFRLPTFNDLYYTQVGNRSLKPERTVQYNVGASYRKEFGGGFLASLDVSLDAYYNEVRDKIVATPTSNQLVWTMLNLGYVEIRGIDVAVDPGMRIGRTRLHTRLNYTFQRARDFSPDRKPLPDASPTVRSNYGDQIPYTPRHSGSAVLGASYLDWGLDYSFIYTGERYALGDNTPANHIRPWYTHDVAISRDIRFTRATLHLGLEVNNIFNRHYEVVKWYPMPGTNFRIVLSLTI